MMRWWLYGLCCWLGMSCTAHSGNPAIHIGVAASVAPVLDSLKAVYQEKHPEITIHTTVRASGQLAAQLTEGLALDIFVAADTTYTTHLHQQGKGATAPTIYAYGRLALWAPNAPTLEEAWQALREAPSIALAQPAVAPYGTLARRALEDRGWWAALQGQLVYGGSVAQVNHYLQTGAVEAALTAHTSGFTTAGCWILAEYELPQAMLLVQSEGRRVQAEARAFYAFLQSEEARAIWQHFGYRVPE